MNGPHNDDSINFYLIFRLPFYFDHQKKRPRVHSLHVHAFLFLIFVALHSAGGTFEWTGSDYEFYYHRDCIVHIVCATKFPIDFWKLIRDVESRASANPMFAHCSMFDFWIEKCTTFRRSRAYQSIERQRMQRRTRRSCGVFSIACSS